MKYLFPIMLSDNYYTILRKGGMTMFTSKIKIVVSRSDLKKKSEVKPLVKKASKKAESDSNYYQKAVETLYEAIDVLSLIVCNYFYNLFNSRIIFNKNK